MITVGAKSIPIIHILPRARAIVFSGSITMITIIADMMIILAMMKWCRSFAPVNCAHRFTVTTSFITHISTFHDLLVLAIWAEGWNYLIMSRVWGRRGEPSSSAALPSKGGLFHFFCSHPYPNFSKRGGALVSCNMGFLQRSCGGCTLMASWEISCACPFKSLRSLCCPSTY